jgi:hypothetical protein
MESSPLSILAPFLFGAAALLLVAVLRGWHIHDRRVDMLLAIVFIVTMAIIAGSVDLGSDAASYRNRYEQLVFVQGVNGWWEPGFEYLALAFALLGAPYGLFVFAVVLLSHLLELHVYSKVCTNITLAFFVLFCFNVGEVAFVRQYLAASILLISFYFLEQRRILWGVCLILCAALVHKSALPVGGLLLLLSYGRKAIKPLACLALLVVFVYVFLPPDVTQALTKRVVAQIASYTAQGFVQGFEAQDTSLFRNVVKFFIYGLLAVWMLMVPARNSSESLQARSAYFVLILSGISLVMVVLISPVFSRMSTYAFPFLALAMRTERFSPRSSELPVQIAAVTILLANLYISLYPLTPYL